MDIANPSLFQMKCPYCGSGDYTPLGIKKSAFKKAASGFAAGAMPITAAYITNQQAKNQVDVTPLEYQCSQCKKKYEFLPLPANSDEILNACCDILFERAKVFRGSAALYTVYLNGALVGTVPNGSSITFQTNLRFNTVFVGYGQGALFKNLLRFEASPGGSVRITYDGNFLFA